MSAEWIKPRRCATAQPVPLNLLHCQTIDSLPAGSGGGHMALMTWNNSFSVGVRKIDSQHTVLVDILNDLHTAMMNGQAQSLTGPLLHKLADYAHTHFADEEAMMEAARYPGLDDHKIKHRELVKQVEDYILRYNKGDITLNLKLLDFLSDWFANHIQKEDMAYSACLIQHGMH
jgi:hemerythrin-like metal-binding protein